MPQIQVDLPLSIVIVVQIWKQKDQSNFFFTNHPIPLKGFSFHAQTTS